ncbi:MAG: RluA family pseudouridine synthase [Flavobacteriaceae bacterium]|nr:RluA family pseudouridine synthase [Flavobacteriaceae bacterium]MCY4267344.1 RluA family pseudouridine synthase [Flavobacteriaceae bacterium]
MEGSDLVFENQKLYEHYSLTVDKGQSPYRIDKFLLDRIPDITRNRIQNALKGGNIQVNQLKVKPNYRVKPLDEIKILLNFPQYQHLLKAEKIPVDIVYEDLSIIIVNKPAGMVVHPGHGNYSGTLLNGLIHHFNDLPLNSDNKPGLVHRLDKDTSGLLLIAKTEASLDHLSKQFKERSVDKQYVALVWGDITSEHGTIDVPIGRNPQNRLQMTTFGSSGLGKKAITHFKVLQRFGYTTLISCKLETGRTHQIRVHLKHLGHPLFNDPRYGGNNLLKGIATTKYKQFIHHCFTLLPGQALHAKTLSFIHPKTKERMTFDSRFPVGLNSLIERWKNYVHHH